VPRRISAAPPGRAARGSSDVSRLLGCASPQRRFRRCPLRALPRKRGSSPLTSEATAARVATRPHGRPRSARDVTERSVWLGCWAPGARTSTGVTGWRILILRQVVLLGAEKLSADVLASGLNRSVGAIHDERHCHEATDRHALPYCGLDGSGVCCSRGYRRRTGSSRRRRPDVRRLGERCRTERRRLARHPRQRRSSLSHPDRCARAQRGGAPWAGPSSPRSFAVGIR
jgi:hypothetical protein